METVELSQKIALDAALDRRAAALEASDAERSTLARRFELIALDALTFSGELAAIDEAVRLADPRLAGKPAWRLSGVLRARGAQRCVASGEPAPFAIEAPVERSFALGAPPEDAIEVDVDPFEEDLDWLEAPRVDLGEVIAEALALELPALPRRADAPPVALELGPPEDAPSGAFAALSTLSGRRR